MEVFDEAWVAYVIRVVLISLRSEHAASRAGVHSGDVGVADRPHRLEVREHVPEKLANK